MEVIESDDDLPEVQQAFSVLEHCASIVSGLSFEAALSARMIKSWTADHGVVQLAYAVELFRRQTDRAPLEPAAIDQILRLWLRDSGASETILRSLADPANSRPLAVLDPLWRGRDPRVKRLSVITRLIFSIFLREAELDGFVTPPDETRKFLPDALVELRKSGLMLPDDRRPQLHPDYHGEILIAWDHWLSLP